MGDRLLGKKRYAFYKDPFVIVLIILIFLLLCRGLFSARYIGIYVVGNSMSPTLTGAPESYLSGGDYLYADTYVPPERGDIVVVESPSGGYIIKRVIALGGDSLYMEDGIVYIMYEGENSFIALEESYVLPENNDPDLSYNSYRSEDNPLVVPENSMFLLGDNRGSVHDGQEIVSNDSRHYGTFGYDTLIGVITDWSLSCKSFFTGFYSFFAFGKIV